MRNPPALSRGIFYLTNELNITIKCLLNCSEPTGDRPTTTDIDALRLPVAEDGHRFYERVQLLQIRSYSK